MAAGLDKSSGVFYMGIVKDGVRCGDNKICVNQTCKDIPYDMVKYTKCPQNIPPHGGKMEECSTNGVSRMINFQFPVKKSFLQQKILSEMFQYQHMCL